jgi:hypothetical protein
MEYAYGLLGGIALTILALIAYRRLKREFLAEDDEDISVNEQWDSSLAQSGMSNDRNRASSVMEDDAQV